MRVPTVHLNGTSAESLMKQLRDAAEAVDKAIGKCAEAMPHGRDYYVQDTSPTDYVLAKGAAQEAIAEMRARIAKLEEVEQELCLMHQAVFEQKNRR